MFQYHYTMKPCFEYRFILPLTAFSLSLALLTISSALSNQSEHCGMFSLTNPCSTRSILAHCSIKATRSFNTKGCLATTSVIFPDNWVGNGMPPLFLDLLAKLSLASLKALVRLCSVTSKF